MSKKVQQNVAELPKVISAISSIQVPMLIQATICPHCGELNVEDFNDGTQNKEITTSCLKCENDYIIRVPDYKK